MSATSPPKILSWLSDPQTGGSGTFVFKSANQEISVAAKGLIVVAVAGSRVQFVTISFGSCHFNTISYRRCKAQPKAPREL
jgi:hypothetical protein